MCPPVGQSGGTSRQAASHRGRGPGCNSLYERVQAELARSFEPGQDGLMEHVR